MEEKIQARKTLLASAYYFIYCAKWSVNMWVNDDEVLDLAYSHGVEDELEHIAALAKSGFNKG